MAEVIKLEKFMELKGGENSHLNAELLSMVDDDGKHIGKDVYSEARDLGEKVRKKGWTNIGDMSASLKTTVGLNEIYKDSETPHIAVSSKHTRPCALATGKTQLEALKKALAGNINPPFGGFFSFNKTLEYETAEFLDKIFFEGVVAPSYAEKVASILKDTGKIKAHQKRFVVETGELTPDDLEVLGYNLQPVGFGKFLKQDLEKAFDARKECVVVTGNKGNQDINSLDKQVLEDITFAGNAAIYLSSNLVFYVHNRAIAGLGGACEGRIDAAERARRALDISAYAALTAKDKDRAWKNVLYDTPFTREDFESVIKTPLRITAFSDAFYPKLDGFVETVGLDRIHKDFQDWNVVYIKNRQEEVFIPRRDNYDPDYNKALIPEIVVQPGGSIGDNVVLNMAVRYGVKMAFTMTPVQYKDYCAKKKVTGRRFFGHNIM